MDNEQPIDQMRVLVTGAAGMLGSQIMLGVPDGADAVGTDLRAAPGVEAVGTDLTDAAQVAELFEKHGPFTGVIHSAAYTAVDRAEADEPLALAVNRDACEVLAQACKAADIPLVAVGTDFVFDGSKRTPYTVDDSPNPLSAYGRTKLAGEEAARAVHPTGTRIVRTQWLYGPRGKHFPATMQQLARERDSLRVVADQIGSPTSTLELAPALWDVLAKGEAGVYHAACEGSCSWYDLAVATLEYAGLEGTTVEPCGTEDYPTPAVRPAYTVLDCSRLTALRGAPLADWRDALKTYLGNGDQ
ncbi:MAG: dTDP-4-dehydrorhamnose reductase [Planctomycetota bacterium]|jgi:dTDP-4-dehydrorhamnose reductase